MLYDLTAIDERMRRASRGASRRATSPSSITCCPSNETRMSGSRCRSTDDAAVAPDHHRSLAGGELVRARSLGHVRHRASTATRTCGGSSCRRPGKAIRCARTTRRAPPRWAFPAAGDKQEAEQEALRFRPEEWGMKRAGDGTDFMFLNVGPQHPGTHGVLRIVLQLDGEEIVDAVPDIGYHHRGAEKMGERQIVAHLHPVHRSRRLPRRRDEQPRRTCWPSRSWPASRCRTRAQGHPHHAVPNCSASSSHLVWYGTFAQDLGALSPVFYMFTDRERAARDHRGDLRRAHAPELVSHRRGRAGPARRAGIDWCATSSTYLPPRLDEYDTDGHAEPDFQGAHARASAPARCDEAIEWGVTGPVLRACGFEWDFRKKRPYSGYDQFEFDIPTAQHGDCYDRAVVRVEEMRQSLRIIEQCVEQHAGGPV